MDRNKMEDKMAENICNPNSSQGKKRLTPGKFVEPKDTETNFINNTKNFDENKEDTFFIYSANMDTNSIWNSNPDYKKSASVPSSTLTKQDSLNLIWSSKYNSDESLTKTDEHCQIPPISIDINEFELHEYNLNSVLNDSNTDICSKRDSKENFSVEDRKKISTMINSHDGWGVKPINQNTPWVFPEGENDGDNYPDTFSTWLNDTSNGAYAWEASKKQTGSDWSSNVQVGKTYGISSKQVMWPSSGTNESMWGNSNVCNKCGIVGSNKVKTNVNPSFITHDLNNANYITNAPRSERSNHTNQNIVKNSCWPNEIVSRQVNDFKSTPNSIPLERFPNHRTKNIENELQLCKQYKEMMKQILDQFQKEQRKIIEIDNNLNHINKLSDSQSSALFNELLRQRQATQQRMHVLRPQHEAIALKLNNLEERLSNIYRSVCSTTSVDKQFPMVVETTSSTAPGLELLTNKLSSMQVQPTQDFRLDVPEFVPGKKWHGLSQNGKENRNPTTYNKLSSQYSENCNDNQETNSYGLIWLFIQNLPSHVTLEMIQNFFIQSNNPCVMPIHSNPFSRWMLIRFPNSFSSQKALQLLSGKIGQTTLITDQDANIKLQELKGTMAKFVAHHIN